MKKLWLIPFCLLAFSGIALAEETNEIITPAQDTKDTASPSVTNAMSEDQLNDLVKKTNIYVRLLNRSARGLDSWKRYTSWANPKKNLTGKEKNASYGLYSLYDDVIKTIIPKVLNTVDEDPKLPALDQSAKEYVKTLEVLHPLVAEADSYYDRQDYRDDNFVKGKELHPKLVDAFQAYMTAREKFDTELTTVKDSVDIQLLDRLEKEQGKKFAWHKKNIFMATSKTLDKLSNEKISQNEIDNLVKNYAETVHEFDAYMKTADDKTSGSSAYASRPNTILRKLRDFRDYKKKKNQNRAIQAYNDAVREYNHMVTFGN